MTLIRARDGCGLFAATEGDGEPLLFIPGLGGSAMFWTGVVSHLRARFQIVLMDHRGAGRSERPEQSYSVEELARDALDVLDHFGLECAHLVGHSTGGAIAQVLAIDHASRVKRLVLSGSWARPDARFRLLFEARLAILDRAGPDIYAAMSQILGYPPDWIDDHTPELKAERERADLEPLAVTAERIRMVLRFDRSADLHRIAAPTLVVGASDDMIVPFHHSEQLAHAIANARLMKTHGGHFFPRVDPQTFAQTVADFIGA